jgi:Flp pilus assembly protein TadD
MNVLIPQGRFAEAEGQLREARRLDPLSPAVAASVGLSDYFARDYERAEAALREALDLAPDFGVTHFFLGQTYAQLERHDDAAATLRRAVDLLGRSTESVAALAHARALAGAREEAQQLLEELEARSRAGYVAPTLLAHVHAGLGDTDRALDALERACEVRAADVAWLKVRPVFDPLAGHPRFRRLLTRLGLGPSQP